MNTAYRKVCLLLSAASYRETELVEFAQSLCETDISQFVSDVMSARGIFFELAIKDRSEEAHRPRRHQPTSATEEKVLRLLVSEARLSKAAAAELMRSEIERRHPGIPLRPLGRTSFVVWLKHVTNLLPSSEVLHLATVIRNERVHSDANDWNLK